MNSTTITTSGTVTFLKTAMLILFLTTSCTLIIYYILRWRNRAAAAADRQQNAAAAAELADVEKGIDEESLKSYPKVIYGEDDQAASAKYDIVCPICLSDYKDAQALRLLPDCGHMFHVECVDVWLRRHPTCPVCRCTPLPSMSMTTLADSY